MNMNRRQFTLSSAAALGALSAGSLDAAAPRNRRIVLASRPAGKPSHDNLRLETVDLPALGDGEVLLKTLYLSLDPYMRGRMNAGPSYAPSVGLGEVIDLGPAILAGEVQGRTVIDVRA